MSRERLTPDETVAAIQGRASRGWRDSERDVRRFFIAAGEFDAQLGPGSRDGGVDIESARLVVQVKDWTAKVSAPSVRQIFGVAQALGKTACVVARAGFTADARAFADRAGVALFTFDASGLTPLNDRARALFRR